MKYKHYGTALYLRQWQLYFNKINNQWIDQSVIFIYRPVLAAGRASAADVITSSSCPLPYRTCPCCWCLWSPADLVTSSSPASSSPPSASDPPSSPISSPERQWWRRTMPSCRRRRQHLVFIRLYFLQSTKTFKFVTSVVEVMYYHSYLFVCLSLFVCLYIFFLYICCINSTIINVSYLI